MNREKGSLKGRMKEGERRGERQEGMVKGKKRRINRGKGRRKKGRPGK